MWNTVIGFILGAIVSFVSTVCYDYYKQYKTRRNLAVVISQEIQSIVEFLREKKVHDFLSNDKATVITFTTNYNYFTVYESNSNSIALFGQEVSQEIFRFYNRIKALFEDLKVYSDRIVETGSTKFTTTPEIKQFMKKQYQEILEQENKVIELLKKENEKKLFGLFLL